MLKFVTKREYWAVEDSGATREYPNYPQWHLKSIQDAMVWGLLRSSRGRHIAEIGGGQSRLIGPLARHNHCYNIEPFEGAGQGPRQEVNIEGVTNLLVSVGDFSEQIRPGQFDALFSVSVVEHVPNDRLPDFFRDCLRILKPGGEMIHLIDVYLESPGGNNAAARTRTALYAQAFGPGLFRPAGPVDVTGGEEVAFRADMATNPDDMMNRWNRGVPQLRAKREVAQSCTLIMHGIRDEDPC